MFTCFYVSSSWRWDTPTRGSLFSGLPRFLLPFGVYFFTILMYVCMYVCHRIHIDRQTDSHVSLYPSLEQTFVSYTIVIQLQVILPAIYLMSVRRRMFSIYVYEAETLYC